MTNSFYGWCRAEADSTGPPPTNLMDEIMHKITRNVARALPVNSIPAEFDTSSDDSDLDDGSLLDSIDLSDDSPCNSTLDDSSLPQTNINTVMLDPVLDLPVGSESPDDCLNESGDDSSDGLEGASDSTTTNLAAVLDIPAQNTLPDDTLDEPADGSSDGSDGSDGSDVAIDPETINTEPSDTESDSLIQVVKRTMGDKDCDGDDSAKTPAHGIISQLGVGSRMAHNVTASSSSSTMFKNGTSNTVVPANSAPGNGVSSFLDESHHVARSRR